MRGGISAGIRLGSALISVLVALPIAEASDPLEVYRNATLVEAEYNDADSFRVRFKKDGKIVEEVIRLYYVDSPETTFATESDLRRVREQSRYFGVEDERRKLVIEYGEKARAFVLKALKKPFTI